jgi:hypothetical protein
MANQIKESSDGLALQVTLPARDAGLVKENADGDPEWLAGVYVYGFDGVLVVVDAEKVSAGDRADLVATAAEATGSVHRGAAASLAEAGNGYQVQLPGCRSAGFSSGDKAPVHSGRGVLVVHDGTESDLARDLVAGRAERDG